MNINNGKTGNVNIPGALHSTGGDGDGQVGGVVAYAGDVYDETLGKNQKEINQTLLDGSGDSNVIAVALNDLNEKVEEQEKVTSSGLNDLNDKTDNLTKDIEDLEKVTSSSLNDLDNKVDNLNEKVNDSELVTASALTDLDEKTDTNEKAVSAALNDLNDKVDERIVELQNAISVNVDSVVSNSDLDITDEDGNILVQFENGEIRVKEFDSANAPKLGDTVGNDLEIKDSNGNVLVRFLDGHIKTKYFDSRNIGGNKSSDSITTKYNGKRICILGDSISTFGDPDSRNQNGTYCYSYYPTQTCRYSVSGNVTDGGSTYDSIQFDVQNTWWMKLINQLGANLGINESWRGTKVSGSGNNIFASQTRIGHLGENGTPDLILVYGGTNDAGATAGKTPEQVAEMLGTFNTENPASYTDEQIAALSTTTFADAYRTMLIRLQKTYPSSEIVVILPTFTSTYYTITNLDLFVEVIKEACDFFGVKYIDIRTCGITCFNKNTYLVDGIHPNVAGMKLISDKIYKHLIYN